MILFKHPESQREFADLDARLVKVASVMEAIAWQMTREALVVTCIYDPQPHPQGTHSQPPPYRFIDFALPVRLDAQALRSAINVLFPRTDGRETIPPLEHGAAPHLHVQVGDSTQVIGV